jgi:hypothetical protein
MMMQTEQGIITHVSGNNNSLIPAIRGPTESTAAVEFAVNLTGERSGDFSKLRIRAWKNSRFRMEKLVHPHGCTRRRKNRPRSGA